ncbi:MAG: sensor histidine kinase [Lysobacterales bacterium]
MIAAETESNRGALLASISHDLRTPLAVLTGASSSLVETGDWLSHEERTALAESIYQQAREVSDQVDKILQMTRIESGVITLNRDWTDLSEIVGAVLARLSGNLAHHHVLVDIADHLPLVFADASLIEQVLVNLLDNARRHTPPGTIVQVRARTEAEDVVVSVVDSGPGIEEGEIERLFVKFQRGAAEGVGSGIGLGLAICRAIVAMHGGKIWAERMLDGGSAFRFSLPLLHAPAPPVENDSA